MPSFSIIIKAARQMGLRPLALFALYKLGLKTGYYKRIENREKRVENRGGESSPLFALPDRDELQKVLGQDGQRALLAEADEIVSGKFRRFGGDLVPLELSFAQPLQHWTIYETQNEIRKTLIIPHDDIKYVWEPARFGWAFALGRAYHITRDEKYAHTFWKYFESFMESNPPYLGPHWMNGQEVAIRLMALIFCAHVFSDFIAQDSKRKTRLATVVHDHALRISRTLVYARAQNNNHLVTESAALYMAGLYLQNPKWRALGWKWLHWAFQNQIGGYGEYIQHSANYHRLMLQTALWINLIKQDIWPADSSQALARSAHWLFSLLDNETGSVPNLGANDGALIFPLSAAPFNDFRPTVQAAARAFLKTQIKSGVWDEMSLWFNLPPAKKTHDPEQYLSDQLRGRETWAYLRASRFKSRLSHADQLHLDLWYRGLNIAQDAGTYLYNAPSPWDNPLVTTRVHNTVTVDGRDQTTRAGRFLMLDWVDAYSEPEIATDENVLQRVKAYHKGYRGVKHERTVTVFTDERWIIEDKLESYQPHTYRLHWLLPDWEWQGIENREKRVENSKEETEIKIKSPHGWIVLKVSSGPVTNYESRITLIRAGETLYGSGQPYPFEGWVSPTYGTKQPALSFAVEVFSSQPITFTSEFVFP